MLLTLLLAGCAQTTPTVDAVGPLDAGWIPDLLAHPTLFAQTVDAERPGWIALSRSDWPGASQQLTGQPRARALRAQARFEGDLARVAHFAWRATFTAWDQHSGLPQGTAIPLVVALSALDWGEDDVAQAWLQRLDSTDPRVTALGQALTQGGLHTLDLDDPVSTCINAHLRARASHDLAPLSACPGGALLTEAGEDHQRRLYDPLLFHTRQLVHAAQAGAEDGDTTLPALLFSDAWTAADLHAQGIGPTLLALGLGDDPGTDDAPQVAREWARDLDSALDPWLARQLAATQGDARELLEGLQLVPRYRSGVLLTRARAALVQDHPRQALAFAQLALDVEHAREIGPINPPGLYAVMAEAQLRTGHTREALDALEVLTVAWPEIRGLDETVGDLAVIEGLGRQGDSKEN